MTNSLQSNEYPRHILFAISVFSFLTCLFGSTMMLVFYAFSTMVDPDLPVAERFRLISHKFLFNDGPTQIVLIVIFSLASFTGLISTITHTSAMVCRMPTPPTAMRVSGIGGAIATALFVGYFLWKQA